MVNQEKEYSSILNWNQKYYNLDSEFIKYLIDKNKIIDSIKTKELNNEEQNFITVINKKKKKNNESIKIEKNKLSKLNNNDMFDFNDNIDSDNENKNKNINMINNNFLKNDIVTTNKQNNGTYEELQADENYAIYISEVVDNNIKNKKESIVVDKKKKKNDKNIFVTNKQESKILDQPINKIENINIIKEFDEQQSSVFNKTEKISNKNIEKICDEIKISMGLETIQAYALKLGLGIFEGATKTGKPKNKTKLELIEQIKVFRNKIF